MAATTFKLEYPIDLEKDGSNVISEVELKRFKAKTLQQAEKLRGNSMDFGFFLIGESTGLSKLEIAEMDAADYSALVDELSGFLSRDGK